MPYDLELPTGPWDDEHNREEWRYRGLVCLVKRGPMHQWCGYVGLPPGHPLHGVGYGDCPTGAHDSWECDEAPQDILHVHGGLTYANGCQGEPGVDICHVPEPGEDDDVWWFGFDCAHMWDLVPGMLAMDRKLGLAPLGDSTYRDVAYVKQEVTHLADQLVDLVG